MYKLQDWAAVQRVYRETKSIRATARLLDMARNTVRSLLDANEEPKYNRTVCKSVIDDYKEQIIEWRCKPFEYNGTRIFRELQKIGYKGSIGPVYRFLRRLDEDTGQTSSKACERIETPVGDQAQFDWSEYSIELAGQERKVYLFIVKLKYRKGGAKRACKKHTHRARMIRPCPSSGNTSPACTGRTSDTGHNSGEQ